MFKKKSLGQHFLTAESYIRSVADAADVTAEDVVLEIGPGDGALTRELLSRGARVTVIEKDHRLIPILGARFDTEVAKKQLSIVEGDALEISAQDLVPRIYKVVANIPYYITGALLRQYLTAAVQPSMLVFLMQKEVAERIARSKKESLLSLSVKAYGNPLYIKTVPRGAFSPPPDVDSAILCVKDVSRAHFSDSAHEEKFFALLHAGFGQKRKLLVRNIEAVVGENAAELLQKAGIEPKARAEDVSLTQWLTLAHS